MQFAWKMAYTQMRKIHEMQTPKTKLMQIEKAIFILQHSLKLYKGDDFEVNADVLIAILPYLFVKANIPRMLAHYNFTSAFHYSTDSGDKLNNIKTNFELCIMRINQLYEKRNK